MPNIETMPLKIYIRNKPLFLCSVLNDGLNTLIHRPDYIFMDELSNLAIKTMLKELALPEMSGGILYHSDLAALKKAVFHKFEVIQAGGGLVLNENKDVLMMFRRGFWDLPKGKLDEGETLENCALREVQEETGLRTLQLIKALTATYHTYEQGTHHILKESHWFLMEATSSETLIPQTEEDITEIKWVPQSELPQYKENTYPSIMEVLQFLK